MPEHAGGAPRARAGRLSRTADYDAVHQLGRAYGGRYLTLRARDRGDGGAPRLGYAVPRKVGTAVDRNAVKRRLREATRAEPDRLRRGWDYVLIARPGIGPALEARGYAWLVEQVAELLDAAAGDR
jgi:ribonuclease P protein component